jgi:hypothetical protein
MNIPRAKERGQRGAWWPALTGPNWAELTARTATIWCPDCGNPMSLINHSIGPTGDVGPSAVCPWPNVECPNRACGWHEVITLDEFAGPREPTKEGT